MNPLTDKFIDIISPMGWGGMVIVALYNQWSNRKEKKVALDKSGFDIVSANLKNVQELYDFYNEAFVNMKKEMEEMKESLKLQESFYENMREQMEQKMEEMRTSHEDKIKQIDEKNRESQQKAESFYREKCRECELMLRSNETPGQN